MASTSWVRQVARALFRPFPGAKHFVVHRILAPWQHWRHGDAAIGRGHVSASDPDIELRLLKLEGALHLARVSGAQTATKPTAAAQRRLVLMDMRITQISMRERGIPRYATALALALPEHLAGADIAYLVDPAQPMPDALAALQARGRIVQGAAEIGTLGHVSHYLQSCIFELHKDGLSQQIPAEKHSVANFIAVEVAGQIRMAEPHARFDPNHETEPRGISPAAGVVP